MYQQYQQQASGTTVQQPAQTWNGSAWVPTATIATGSVAAYDSSSLVQTTTIPFNPVQTYTQYYHQWTALHTQQQQQAASLPQGSSARAQIQQQADWSKYFADASSRAAHHFHQNPGATSAPFDLPPAPPVAPTNNSISQPQPQYAYAQTNQYSSNPSLYAQTNQYHANNNAPTTYPQQQQQNQYAPQNHYAQQKQPPPPPKQPAQSSSSSPPDSLKRYVDKCLAQCTTPSEKKAMMKLVEGTISRAMQQGTLHSTNWEAVSAIPMGLVRGGDEAAVAEKNKSAKTVGNSDSYYGPSMTSATSSHSFSQYGSSSPKKQSTKKKFAKASPKCSYYGPASDSPSSTTPSFSSHSSLNQQQQQSLDMDDFIAVPRSKNKRKFERKNSGFNDSSRALLHRAKRFAGPGDLNDVSTTPDAEMVVKGFDKYMGKSTIGGTAKVLDEADYEAMTVKGTCTTLEKEYLRLTAPPRAERVRPQAILEQHLQNLKAERNIDPKYRRDYLWFCSQLKAIRQDCRVQRIQNAFCVDVYETHARMALEEGDLNEFNQCQTQLKELYELLKDDPTATAHCNEFVAYRLLYYVLLTTNQKYNGGSSDLLNMMMLFTGSEDEAVRHALAVRVAVADVDYHAFSRLAQSCPNLGSCLVDRMVPFMRLQALQRICRAYRPSIEVTFVLRELDFDNDKEFGKQWLVSCGCILSEDGTEIQTKDSVVHESDLDDKTSLI